MCTFIYVRNQVKRIRLTTILNSIVSTVAFLVLNDLRPKTKGNGTTSMLSYTRAHSQFCKKKKTFDHNRANKTMFVIKYPTAWKRIIVSQITKQPMYGTSQSYTRLSWLNLISIVQNSTFSFIEQVLVLGQHLLFVYVCVGCQSLGFHSLKPNSAENIREIVAKKYRRKKKRRENWNCNQFRTHYFI